MMRKLGLLGICLTVLVFTLACGISVAPAGQSATQTFPAPLPTTTRAPTVTPVAGGKTGSGEGGGGGDAASLTVLNNSSTSIFYFYIAPSTSADWGDDQLGSSTIAAGSSYTFTGISPDTYNLKAEDSSHTVIQTWMGVYLSGSTSWTVTAPGGGGGGSSTASLAVINNSSTSIFYLYISLSSSTSWGDDQLGSSTIGAGSSYTFTGIAPGTYDLKAEDSSHTVIQTWMGVNLSGSTTWTVTGSGGGGGSASLAVTNNSGSSIFYFYISPSTGSSWGDDQLGSSTIPAGGSYTFTGIAPGTYDLKAEDSSHTVIQTWMGVSLSGSTTWTVTGSGGGSSTASLTVTNNSGSSIFYFYISPSTSSSWGDDQLGSSTIPAGSSYTFTGIASGTYDLKAEDSSHNVIETWLGVSLSGSSSWTVTGSGGGGGPASLTVYNNSGSSIFYFYISPTSSSSWGDDQLGSSTIPAGGSYTFTGIAPGTYDLKAEDSSHTVIQTWMDVSLSGSSSWTVTGP